MSENELLPFGEAGLMHYLRIKGVTFNKAPRGLPVCETGFGLANFDIPFKNHCTPVRLKIIARLIYHLYSPVYLIYGNIFYNNHIFSRRHDVSFNNSKSMYEKNFMPDKELLEKFKHYEGSADVPLALEILFRWSQSDGVHHKEYAIDQVLHALTGNNENYKKFVKEYQGEYDEEQESYDYEWGIGIAP